MRRYAFSLDYQAHSLSRWKHTQLLNSNISSDVLQSEPECDTQRSPCSCFHLNIFSFSLLVPTFCCCNLTPPCRRVPGSDLHPHVRLPLPESDFNPPAAPNRRGTLSAPQCSVSLTLDSFNSFIPEVTQRLSVTMWPGSHFCRPALASAHYYDQKNQLCALKFHSHEGMWGVLNIIISKLTEAEGHMMSDIVSSYLLLVVIN